MGGRLTRGARREWAGWFQYARPEQAFGMRAAPPDPPRPNFDFPHPSRLKSSLRKELMLDFSIKDPSERVKLVSEICNDPSSDLSDTYLNAMSDYVLRTADAGQTSAERSEEYPMVTKNRQVTTSKRQTSLEGLVESFENGEDGLYSILGDDSQLLDARDLITDDDIESIPTMREMHDLIGTLTDQFNEATGRRKYQLKKSIIETWQQMYLLKASVRGAWASSAVRKQVQGMGKQSLPETVTLDEDNEPVSDCPVSLYNPAHVSFLLTYYTQLKSETHDDLNSDMRWLLLDLENLLDKATRGKPELREVAALKMRGVPSNELVPYINEKYGTSHSEQYMSTIWRRIIPRLVVQEAKKHYVTWTWHTDYNRPWKVCSSCGRVLPKHQYWFPRNSSSDGFYSKCKDCRYGIERTVRSRG